jgi:agmatine deiminase
MPPTNKLWHTQHHAQHNQPDKTKTYICPPETSPHLATLLSFPSRRSTLPDLYTKTATEIITLASTIANFEPVRLHVRPEALTQAEALLSKHETLSPSQRANISLIAAPTNHCWIRDTGPVYVRSADETDKSRYAIDFRFCEWGNKTDEYIYGNDVPSQYADWPVMDAAARIENAAFAGTVLELENESAEAADVVMRVETELRLEGGGIEVDGEGTFMATESSILGEARNPGMTKEDVETELRRLLGVEKFVWFPGRVGLDITDVHVDAEARFIRPGVVVVSRPRERAEDGVHWEIYREIRGVLESGTDARGRRFEVHDVVEPDLRLIKGELPGEEDSPAASYVNFYFVNGGLVIPAFGDVEADNEALELFKRLVPEREVRQVEVNALPRTGGVLHCVTQQVI